MENAVFYAMKCGLKKPQGLQKSFNMNISVPRFRYAVKLNELGAKYSKEYDIPYLYSDFKKRNGYKRSIELSHEYGLYRQNYCGCVYSRMQNELKEQEKNFQNEMKTVVKP